MKGTDLTGQRFGRLVVIEKAHRPVGNSRSSSFWNCTCDCGKLCTPAQIDLVLKQTTSCGCYRDEMIRRKRKRPFENLYNKLVHGAKKRNIIIDLSYEQFVKLTENECCHYCGNKVTWSKYFSKSNTRLATNIDRKDNALGYTFDNCVVCCTRCNRSKSNHFTYDEWKQLGEVIKTFEPSICNVSI